MSPRVNPGRSERGAREFRAYLIEFRRINERGCGWVAQRMSDAGCPTSAGALHKIEKEGRAVYVDELMAFCRAFNVSMRDVLSGDTPSRDA